MSIDPDTRRANFRTMIVLVIFAIALGVVVFLWMRNVTAKKGGAVYPPVTTSLSNLSSHYPIL